ncbi:phage major capsid protein [Paraburkholderia sp. BR10882]|uniref:phage major capsid family protein n=1 Tax=unclassified Paraburkholderia TaxID=2615204 RepID=UPI0034CFCEE2
MRDVTGLTAVRAARAAAVNGSNLVAARAFAAQQWGATSDVCDVLTKQLTDTGSIDTGDATLYNVGAHIVELIERRSAWGRVNALVPFANVPPGAPVLGLSMHATATWTPEAAMIADSAQAFVASRISPLKLAVLTVYSEEFLRLPSPRVDEAIRRDVVRAVSTALDDSMFAPDNAGTPDEQPPSVFADNVLHGTFHPAADLTTLLESLDANQLQDVVLVISPLDVPTCIEQGLNGNGVLTARDGGELLGYPCVTSASVPKGSIGYLIPSEILVVEAGLTLGTSKQSTIAVHDLQRETSQIVSLWQQNAASIRAIRYINWQPLTSNAAGIMLDCIGTQADDDTRNAAPATKRAKGGSNV